LARSSAAWLGSFSQFTQPVVKSSQVAFNKTKVTFNTNNEEETQYNERKNTMRRNTTKYNEEE